METQETKYMTVYTAAAKWAEEYQLKVLPRTVQSWVDQGLIPECKQEKIGAGKYRRSWIPIDAKPPEDATKPEGRKRGPKKRLNIELRDLPSIMSIINNDLTPEQIDLLRAREAARVFYVATGANAKLFGPDQNGAIFLFEHERESLNAALDYYGADTTTVQTELELAVLMARFWDITGRYGEGRDRLLSSIARQPAGITRAKVRAMAWAGHLSFCKDDCQAAREYLGEAINMAHKINDQESLAFANFSLGSVFESEGNYEKAIELLQASIENCEKIGDSANWLKGWSIRWLGVTYEATGGARNLRKAEDCYWKYKELSEEMGHGGGVAGALDHLGTIARLDGNYPSARSYHQQALVGRMSGGNRWGVASCHYHLGLLEEADGDPHQAAIHYKKSLEICNQMDERSGIARALEGLGRAFYEIHNKKALPPVDADADILSGPVISLFRAAEKIRSEAGTPRRAEEEEWTRPVIDHLQSIYSEPWDMAAADSIEDVVASMLPGAGPTLTITSEPS